jgi:type I restriction enzyme M protein
MGRRRAGERRPYIQPPGLLVTTSNKQLNFVQHIHTILKAEDRQQWSCLTTCSLKAEQVKLCVKSFWKPRLQPFYACPGYILRPRVKANVLFFEAKTASRELD